MKDRIIRAKQFARDHVIEIAALGTGVIIGVYGYNAVYVLMHEGSPHLDINERDIQTMLDLDARVVFDSPIAKLVLHAEPLA